MTRDETAGHRILTPDETETYCKDLREKGERQPDEELRIRFDQGITIKYIRSDLAEEWRRKAELLNSIADELEKFQPVPSTFGNVNSKVDAANITLRMAVELIRERAEGKPDTSRKSTQAEIDEMERK